MAFNGKFRRNRLSSTIYHTTKSLTKAYGKSEYLHINHAKAKNEFEFGMKFVRIVPIDEMERRRNAACCNNRITEKPITRKAIKQNRKKTKKSNFLKKKDTNRKFYKPHIKNENEPIMNQSEELEFAKKKVQHKTKDAKLIEEQFLEKNIRIIGKNRIIGRVINVDNSFVTIKRKSTVLEPYKSYKLFSKKFEAIDDIIDVDGKDNLNLDS